MDNTTIETYNQRAEAYDLETADFWLQFPNTFLEKFTELSGKTVLNIGSGPGRDGLLLVDAGKEVVCLDASSEMIKLTTEKGLKSVLGDFNALPFSDSSFEAVWSYTALLHVPKDQIGVALSEIHRVLADSGIFALGLIEGEKEMYRESSGVDLPRWFSFYSRAEIEKVVEEAGFEKIYFEVYTPKTKNYLNYIFRKV